MKEIQELLERQACWQKTRQALSWPEKIRMAERMREAVGKLRLRENGTNQKHGRRNPITASKLKP